MEYLAPRWLPGGNLQTIWPALFAQPVRGAPIALRRERWRAPDGDFVEADWLVDDPPAPSTTAPQRALLVLFHGLEGSSRSHYAQAFAGVARERGLGFVVPHFRGCGGAINDAPRAYHSGDHEEIAWILSHLQAHHTGPLLVVGVSLGGNALMRWAAEAGSDAARLATAVAAVSSPLDLAAGAQAIGRGFNRLVYTAMFLRSMKPKALRKLAQHPGLFDRQALLAARDLRAFDDVFTAPLHGFAGVDDYYARASAKPHLGRVRIPALLLNARNDPFVPADSLPGARDVGPRTTLWQPAHGGHVGFPGGTPPGHVYWMPEQVVRWLSQAAGLPDAISGRGRLLKH
jgi:predicted alpha/beta-fold hydrolase